FQDRTTAHNVSETLRILRALHDGPGVLGGAGAPTVPDQGLANLRVIFSGRLLLAREGANYLAPDCPLPEQPFLRLFEIRGFSRHKAKDYLRDKARVPAASHDAILANSPEPGSVVPTVQWRWGGGAAGAERRYNPFDVKQFAEWVHEDPDLRPEDLKTGEVGHYLQFRILQRLQNDTLRA